MALPPLVDSGISPEDMIPTEASVDVSVPQPEDFAGGAEVMDDGQGGAIIQALAEAMAGAEQEEKIPHNANLAEYLVILGRCPRIFARLTKMTWSQGPSGNKRTLRA